MKFLAALLVITPFIVTTAHAAGDADGDRRSRIQRSIYEVAAGEYPGAPSYAAPMYEGRSATYGPAPVREREYLGPGSPDDPEYFRQENNNRH